MELSIQERLKDLRVERGLTLEQLAEQTHLSKSALGSYEAEDFKDISHYALIKLAKFYGVTADYLLGLSQTRNHPNADLADLRLSDDMIELLKSGLVDNSLLCELAVHPDFPRLMADLEIYVNGIAGKQVQSANAIVDAVSATIMKQYNPGLTDPQLRQLIAAHIDDDSLSGTKTDRVKEIAKALQELDFETYIDKFDMSAFSQNDIYPDIWGYEDEADLIKDDLRNSFENLKKFYEKMAEQERAVLVSIC